MSQISQESISTSSPKAEKETKQTVRQRILSRKAFDFFRKNRSHENDTKNDDNLGRKEDLAEDNLKNAPTTKMSFGFFKNIRKHVDIKSLWARKSKQKKEIDTTHLQSDTSYDVLTLQTDNPMILTEQKCSEELKCDNSPTCSNESCVNVNPVSDTTSRRESSEDVNDILEHHSDNPPETIQVDQAQSTSEPEVHNEDKEVVEYQTCSDKTMSEEKEPECDTLTHNNTAEHEGRMQVLPNISEALTNDIKVKACLAQELLKLSKYGWYWGPISGDEADAKLISEPDGAFLVRDSSDDRYVLTLSFKSSGKVLHARMEHTGGLFSLCNQSESKGFTSVAALINHTMNLSQSAVFCYSRPKYPGYPSFPVRLTKPVSRFTQVRSLQHLCRFVIRQNTRLDNINKLPLPNAIKGYIEEAHY